MTMRKVAVTERKWTGKEYEELPLGEGFFHGWGQGIEEGDSGFASYTVAIVEMPDGSVITPPPERIKFISQPEGI